MSDDSITLEVVDALNAEGFPFMLVGSLSSNLWGIPRSTKDADVVISLGDRSIAKLQGHLPSHMHLDLQMQFEGVTATTKNLITVDNSAFTVELFRLSKDVHDQERFGRRVQRQLDGHSAWFPTAEDVIVTKLRWAEGGGRQKDIADVTDVIMIQTGALDWDYIHRWADEHGTREILDGIVAKVEEAL